MGKLVYYWLMYIKAFFKNRVPLAAGGVLCLLIFGIMLIPGGVEAQGKQLPWMCWSNGPAGDFVGPGYDSAGNEGWGHQNGFTVDVDDVPPKLLPGYVLVADPDAVPTLSGLPYEWSVDAEDLSFSLFRNFPEAIDYQFALDIASGSSDWDSGDSFIKMMQSKFYTPATPPISLDGVVWADRVEYLENRIVSKERPDAVVKYQSRWLDADRPGGGLSTDNAAILKDRDSLEVTNLAAKVEQGGVGNRRITGISEVPTVRYSSSNNINCSGASCSSGYTSSSNTENVNVTNSSIDQNDNESFSNTFSNIEVDPNPGGFWQRIGSGLATVGNFFVGAPEPGQATTDERVDVGYDAYSVGGQSDTARDEIHFDLVLHPTNRQDYKYDFGGEAGEVILPGFGHNVWTYAGVNTNLDKSEGVKRKVADTVDGLTITEEEVFGYRQPSLNRLYRNAPGLGANGEPDSVSRVSAEHIKWPVNIEDLNWFLYKVIPDGNENNRGSATWKLFVSELGSEQLVNSGYGHGTKQTVDVATVTANGGTHICDLDEDDEEVIIRGKINCDTAVEDYYFYSFDDDDLGGTVTDDMLLGGNMLVKAGVEQPLDAKEDVLRKMNRFSFVIREGEAMTVGEVSGRGEDAAARFGVPVYPASRKTYLDDWPEEPIDPNVPYLMVVTFYQSLNPLSGGFDIDQTVGVAGVEDVQGASATKLYDLRIPGRRIRQVICRMFISPSGYEAPVAEEKSWFVKTWGAIKDSAKNIGGAFTGIFKAIFEGTMRSPVTVASKSVSAVCAGMERVDGVVDGSNFSTDPESVLDTYDDSGVVINHSVEDRNNGMEACRTVSGDDVETCSTSGEAVVRSDCVVIPSLKVYVEEVQWLDLDTLGLVGTEEFLLSLKDIESETVSVNVAWNEVVTGAGDAGAWRLKPQPREFSEVPAADSLNDIRGMNRFQKGLADVRLKWKFVSSGVSKDSDRAVRGYKVWVYGDEKSNSGGVKPGDPRIFYLPRYARVAVGGGVLSVEEIDGFNIGALAVPGCGLCPDGRGTSPLGYDAVVNSKNSGFEVVGALGIKESYEAFNEYVNNLPLAPEYSHSIAVAAFVGTPGVLSGPEKFKVGSASEKYELKGDYAACGDTSGDPRIRLLYECGGANYAAGGVVAEAEDVLFGVSLLELSGNGICVDMFTGTPAGLTWGNDWVKTGWWMMWIVAGSVFFVLLVFQGFRMTYDIWIDPQPAIGLREMVPRSLLALALAASSLLMCQIILVLASDLTCYVSQATGITLWGVWGAVFSNLWELLWGYTQSVFRDMFSVKGAVEFITYVTSGAVLVVLGVVILFLFILYLFVKIAFSMLMRIGLIAVLIALSPIAMILYMSDATAHWTKKWVSLFLGAIFQQVVVLFVLYIGFGLIPAYLSSVAGTAFYDMVIFLLLTALVFALAVKVPDILNPGAQGLFGAFGQAFGFAASLAVVAATAGAGAIAGGVAALGAGAGSASAAAGPGAAANTVGAGAAAANQAGPVAAGPGQAINVASQGPGFNSLSVPARPGGQRPSRGVAVGPPGGEPPESPPSGGVGAVSPRGGSPGGGALGAMPIEGTPVRVEGGVAPASGEPGVGGRPAAGAGGVGVVPGAAPGAPGAGVAPSGRGAGPGAGLVPGAPAGGPGSGAAPSRRGFGPLSAGGGQLGPGGGQRGAGGGQEAGEGGRSQSRFGRVLSGMLRGGRAGMRGGQDFNSTVSGVVNGSSFRPSRFERRSGTSEEEERVAERGGRPGMFTEMENTLGRISRGL